MAAPAGSTEPKTRRTATTMREVLETTSGYLMSVRSSLHRRQFVPSLLCCRRNWCEPESWRPAHVSDIIHITDIDPRRAREAVLALPHFTSAKPAARQLGAVLGPPSPRASPAAWRAPGKRRRTRKESPCARATARTTPRAMDAGAAVLVPPSEDGPPVVPESAGYV